MNIEDTTRIQANGRAVYHDLAEGGVLLDVESGEYFSVNTTGRELWKLVDGEVAVSDLVSGLAALTDEPAEVISADVHRFVADMVSRGLLQTVG
jgi:hypothetical protein